MKKIIISILCLLLANNCYSMQKDGKSPSIVEKNLIEQFLNSDNFDEEGNFLPMVSLPNEVKHIIIQNIFKNNSLFVWLTKQVESKCTQLSKDFKASGVFSKDGTTVLTSYRRNAKFWDVSTGKCFQEFNKSGIHWSAILSKEGDKVLTALTRCPKALTAFTPCPYESLATLRDIKTGKCLHEFWHDAVVDLVLFSKDGNKILTASRDKKVKLWDANTGKCLHVFRHMEAIRSAKFSKDGSNILIAEQYGKVKLWDANTGDCLNLIELLLNNAEVNSTKFSKDGSKILIAFGDGTAKLWDIKTLRRLHVFSHRDTIISAKFNKDGNKILTTSRDGTAKLWDIDSGECLHMFSHDALSGPAKFSKDGRKVLTVQYNTAKLWDVNTGICLHRFSHDNAIKSVVLSKDGNKILTYDSKGVIAKLWDINTGIYMHRFRINDCVRSATFSKDGSKILITFNGSGIQLWDIADIKNIQESYRDLTFEQLILIFCVYETYVINRLNKLKDFFRRSYSEIKFQSYDRKFLFPLYKYEHLQKIYKSLNDDIRAVLDNYLENYSKQAYLKYVYSSLK